MKVSFVMRIFLSFCLCSLTRNLGATPNTPISISATTIIQKAESLRAEANTEATVSLRTQEPGRKPTLFKMIVLQGVGRKAYLEFTFPSEEVGRRMLAIETRYWSKFPDSKRVIPISRREAVGNSAFAIADLYQMNIEKDYEAQIVNQDVPCYKKQRCIKLKLTAKAHSAPYHQVDYYVTKSDYFPVMVDFFGASGSLIKKMFIEKKAKLAGKIRPVVTRMVDMLVKGKESTWNVHTLKKRKIPDYVFTKDYLAGR